MSTADSMGPGDDRRWTEAREEMVCQLVRHGIRDTRVLRAMRTVERHLFIPEEERLHCNPYGDHPCSIGHRQTISQPYIVAYMTEKLQIEPGDKVLEIGTGSGYQAAVLAELGAEVFSVETIPALARHARAALDAAGYSRVQTRAADGRAGWPEHGPYHAIVLTCAPETIPQALATQLEDGGRLIAPVGVGAQRLVLLRRDGARIESSDDLPVRFVPMV